MKLLIGCGIAFSVGFACRLFGLPNPAPASILGVVLILAITLGYISVPYLKQLW